MKNVIFITLVLFIGFQAEAQTKIGHVNSVLLFDTLQMAKDAEKKLLKFQEESYAELQEMKKDFEASYMKFEQGKADMSPVIQNLESEKLAKKQQGLEIRQQELEREFQIRQQEENRPIQALITEAVANIAKSNKLSYVLDKNQAIYSGGGIDITSDVISELLKLEAAVKAE
jgi:outer membrane protein